MQLTSIPVGAAPRRTLGRSSSGGGSNGSGDTGAAVCRQTWQTGGEEDTQPRQEGDAPHKGGTMFIIANMAGPGGHCMGVVRGHHLRRWVGAHFTC